MIDALLVEDCSRVRIADHRVVMSKFLDYSAVTRGP
jgi:hypothetical protein